jgi:hypothetical protein
VLVAKGYFVVENSTGDGTNDRYYPGPAFFETKPPDILSGGASKPPDKKSRATRHFVAKPPDKKYALSYLTNPAISLDEGGQPRAVGAPDGADGMSLGPEIEAAVRKRLPKGVFDAWCKNLTIHVLADRHLTLAVPSKLIMQKVDWYETQLLRGIQDVLPNVERIAIVVRPSAPPAGDRARAPPIGKVRSG